MTVPHVAVMNFKELGQRAARAIFDAIEGRYSAGVQTRPCRLAVRASSREDA